MYCPLPLFSTVKSPFCCFMPQVSLWACRASVSSKGELMDFREYGELQRRELRDWRGLIRRSLIWLVIVDVIGKGGCWLGGARSLGSCDRSLKIGVGVRATDSDSDNYLCRSFTTTCTMHRDEEHFSEQIDLGWDVLETNHQNSAQIWRSRRMTTISGA